MISKEKFYGKGICNKNGGITLIALVITIIVLLILAGVTIAALSGDNGILTRAKEAKEKTQQSQKEEEKTLSNMENILGVYNFKNINVADTNPGGVVPENSIVLEDDVNKGIVIKDKNNNEWVWVEVPKTTVFSGLTIDTTGTLTEQNYTDIKNKLIAYAGVYREGSSGEGCNWVDEWYEWCGMTSDEYTTAYRKMLKSVYTYGGFWIGRYEAGIEESIEDVAKARRSHSTITIETSPKAISQKDAIPYNYVYCSEAQALSKEMTPDNSYTSSLMFGIQWDLVCKFLEVKGELATADINSNSTNWGNYNTSKIENIKSGKYAVFINNTALGKWEKISNSYTKQNSGDDHITLLSTGITEHTKKMNIYDFSGNELEWTLEKTSRTGNPCASRGGDYSSSGSSHPASYRLDYDTTSSNSAVSFRSALYK